MKPQLLTFLAFAAAVAFPVAPARAASGANGAAARATLPKQALEFRVFRQPLTPARTVTASERQDAMLLSLDATTHDWSEIATARAAAKKRAAIRKRAAAKRRLAAHRRQAAKRKSAFAG